MVQQSSIIYCHCIQGTVFLLGRQWHLYRWQLCLVYFLLFSSSSLCIEEVTILLCLKTRFALPTWFEKHGKLEPQLGKTCPIFWLNCDQNLRQSCFTDLFRHLTVLSMRNIGRCCVTYEVSPLSWFHILFLLGKGIISFFFFFCSSSYTTVSSSCIKSALTDWPFWSSRNN